MKVAELISILMNLDPTLDVVRPGYEGGYEDVSCIGEINLIPNFHDKKDWYYGPHEHPDMHYGTEGKATKQFVSVS
jgi:hypothetical protein